ncbi:MAG: hypothetical protein IKB22_03475 [Lentisphaeria bacterium]|nr:hypothetical protein [Lentisphaeria bacterium]
MEETQPDLQKLRRKADKLVLCILLPIIIAAALLLIFSGDPKLTMGDGYLFCSAGENGELSRLVEPGGNLLLGPARIRLWGAYPYVYGTSDDPACAAFILDMKEHVMTRYPEEKKAEYMRFLLEQKLDPALSVSWYELFRDPGDPDVRKNLRDLVSYPARPVFAR